MSVVILLAAFLRFHRLDRTPPALYHDEAYYGLDAERLLRTGRLLVFFPANGGREPLHIYLLAGALALWGEHPLTLRVVAAFSGILAIPLMYRLGSELFWEDGPRAQWVGLLAAGALAVVYWHVNFSRIAFRAIHLVPFSLLTAWLFWRARRRSSYRLFALSGVALGLSLYTYLAARFLPLVFLAFFLADMAAYGWRERAVPGARLRSPHLLGGLLTLSLAGLVCIPLGVYFWTHPGDFIQRTQGISILTPGVVPDRSPLSALADNLWRVARMFVDRGDPQTRLNLPGRPALDPLMLAGLIAALGRAGARPLRPRNTFLLLWWGAMLAPTLLSIEAPHFLRAIGALPPTLLFVADGLTGLWKWLTAVILRSTATPWPILLISLVTLSGALTYYDYFFRWAKLPDLPDAFDATWYSLAQHALELSRSTDVAVPLVAYTHPTVLFHLEPIFQSVAPIDGWPADRPVTLLDPDDLSPAVSPWMHLTSRLAPEHWVLLHRTGTRRGTAFVPPPPAADAMRQLEQSADSSLLRDLYGRPAAYAASGAEGLIGRPSATRQSIEANFGNIISLAGYELWPAVVRPGERVRLTLYWKSLRATAVDYQVFVHLVDAFGTTLDQRDVQPLNGAHPTRLWQPGDIVPDPYDFTLPADIAPGKFRFDIGLYQVSVGERLPIVSSSGEPAGDDLVVGVFTVPDPALDVAAIRRRLDVRVGDPPILELLGYDLSTQALAPGQTLSLVLYWQALQPIGQDYTVFVHLLDDQGQLYGQQDGQPADGRSPTSLWYPGEILRDAHAIELSPDLPPGQYTISIGLYYWVTGERLPLSGADPASVSDNAVRLPEAVVVARNAPR